MANIQYTNSKLFGLLFEKGGAGLVAAFSMLQNGRNGDHCYMPIVNTNNKKTSGKRLISRNTGMSLSALNTYLPILEELGICYPVGNGSYHVVGANKIDRLFNNKKKVPVVIGKNLRATKSNVFKVLMTANLYRQANAIDKNITLHKAKRRVDRGLPVSIKECQLLKNFYKKDSERDLPKKVENIVLSNMGISNLITGAKKALGHKTVSQGSYWRKKWQNEQFIHSRRRYTTISETKISYAEFKATKKYLNETFGFVTYKNGRVVKPICSEVLLVSEGIIDSSYNTSIIYKSLEKLLQNTEDPLLPLVSQTEKRLSIKRDGDFNFITWLQDNPEINVTNYEKYK